MKKALLLVGHGSRRQGANDTLVRLCRMVREKRPENTVAHAFLQMARPGVQEAVEELYRQGVREITVVPVFLFEGVHIHEDIPEILASARAKYPDLKLVQAGILGIDERMADMVWERADSTS